MAEREQKFITIGKIRMTIQAFIMLSIGIAITLGLTILSVMFRSTILLIMAFVFLSIFILNAYIMNCLVVGKCIVLSWILVAFYIFYIIFVIVPLAFRLNRIASMSSKSKGK